MQFLLVFSPPPIATFLRDTARRLGACGLSLQTLGLLHSTMSGLATGWAFGAMARPTAEGCLTLCAWAIRSCVGLWAWPVTHCVLVWAWTIEQCLPLWAWTARNWAWACANPWRAVLVASFWPGIFFLGWFMLRLVWWFRGSPLRSLHRRHMEVAVLGGMTVGAWIFPGLAWLLYLGGSNLDANPRPETADAIFAVLMSQPFLRVLKHPRPHRGSKGGTTAGGSG